MDSITRRRTVPFETGVAGKDSAKAKFPKLLKLAWLLAALGCSAGFNPLLAQETESADDQPSTPISNLRDDGYRGIWFTLGQRSEYGDKYSGGLGTYTAKHLPLAIHVPAANKTFFVYGGARAGQRHLLALVGYFDHATGLVPRPTIVHDKQGVDDPHDNPSLAIDEAGHLWVFVSGRGRRRPGYIYRGVAPYSIDAFAQVVEGEFTYPQPFHSAQHGFLHLFTRYTRGRELYLNHSRDGLQWSEPQKLAGMGGHYQISNHDQGRVFSVFNMHPEGNVDRRTNMYYVETRDWGQSWQTVDGRRLGLPLEERHGPALIRDFEKEGLLVYNKDIQLDGDGHPVILTVLSQDHRPGPGGSPRMVTVVRWDGSQWLFLPVTETTHNYDTGSLYLEADGSYRIFFPSEPGPQRWGTGGEVAIWTSHDQGASWTAERQVTRNSALNHSYVRRPVGAHDDFYAFWADGNPDEFSPSRLHFTNRAGSRVWQLPYDMDGDYAQPAELVSEER